MKNVIRIEIVNVYISNEPTQPIQIRRRRISSPLWLFTSPKNAFPIFPIFSGHRRTDAKNSLRISGQFLTNAGNVETDHRWKLILVISRRNIKRRRSVSYELLIAATIYRRAFRRSATSEILSKKRQPYCVNFADNLHKAAFRLSSNSTHFDATSSLSARWSGTFCQHIAEI